MQAFNAPLMLPLIHPDHWPGWADRAAEFLIVLLAQGKFYTLFSFLFGLGLAIQMGRVEARDGRFAPLYARRLLVLLGIGLVHAFLIWMGDILVIYALFGFALMPFRRRSERTLLLASASLLLVPLLFAGGGAAAAAMGWYRPELDEQMAEMRGIVDASFRVYASGSFGEIMARRAQDILFGWSTMIPFGTPILTMFLLGLWAGRRRLFEDVEGSLPLLRRVRAWGLALGLGGSLIVALVTKRINPFAPSAAAAGFTVAYLVGHTALCLCYVSALTLLARGEAWRRRLAALAPVGRTALSNYLLQSIVATLIFYPYGLGLYGRVGPARGLLLAAAIYAVQVPLSAGWLKRFRFGPAEWVWRSLTYGRAQPMRA